MSENQTKKLTKGDLYRMYARSTFLLGSFNFERMQSMGFCVTMMPAIKRLYSTKEERAAALKRHLEFFNTQPWIGSAIMGVTAAMEEQRANGAAIDDGAISGVKVGLMGPLAGVGDRSTGVPHASSLPPSAPYWLQAAASWDRCFSSSASTSSVFSPAGTA